MLSADEVANLRLDEWRVGGAGADGSDPVETWLGARALVAPLGADVRRFDVEVVAATTAATSTARQTRCGVPR